jgi:hypothetical protein
VLTTRHNNFCKLLISEVVLSQGDNVFWVSLIDKVEILIVFSLLGNFNFLLHARTFLFGGRS